MPTKIEWSGESWNPIRARTPDGKIGWHCEHASPGCQNCYAETQNVAQRWDLGTGLAYKPGHRKDVEIYVDEAALVKPLSWRKGRKVFVCSMTDLFADFVTDAMIDRIFAVMASSRQHTFQVLTKRSARMREYLSRFKPSPATDGYVTRDGRESRFCSVPEPIFTPERWPLPNVWLGVSVEDQQRADERIPDLLATPAAVRWISAEPLLGPVDLTGIRAPRYTPEDEEIDWRFNCLNDGDYYWFQSGDHKDGGDGPMRDHAIDWVVAGGESGPNARPMHPDWARTLRDQCAAASVPFFFKQWGEWAPAWGSPKVPSEVLGDMRFVHMFEDRQRVGRFGKKQAGRLLDGVEHNGMPGGAV